MAFGSINDIPLSPRRLVILRAQLSKTAGSLNFPSPLFFSGGGTSPEKSSQVLSVFFSSGNGVPSQRCHSLSCSSQGESSSFPSSLTSSGPLSPGSSPFGGAEPLMFGLIGGLVFHYGAELDLFGFVDIGDDCWPWGCHGHKGMNYVTRPWASDQGNTRQFTNYVTRSWASDEDDIRTIKGQYRHSPRGECQQSEEQLQTSISHHSPRCECQYLNINVTRAL